MPTAVNPQTGERIELVNGQWVPVQEQSPELRDRALAVAQGATLGWGDELSAGMAAGMASLLDDADFGEAYDDIVRATREREQAYKEANPNEALALELGGGLLTGGAGASRVAAAKTTGSLLGRSMAAGAGFGGAAGAGYADDGDRLSGAMKGAAAGGAMGLAAPAVTALAGKAVSPLTRMAQNKFSKPTTKAARLLARDMGRDRLTPARAEKALRGMGDDAMLADVGGPNVYQLTDQVMQQPGAGQSIARRSVAARDRMQSERVSQALSDALGQPASYYDNIDDLMAARSSQAGPLYDKAFSQTVRKTDKLRNILDDDIAKQGLKRGAEIERLESLATGRTINPSQFSTEGDDVSIRAIDAVKRGLDDILEGYRDKTTGKLVLDQRGRAIESVRKAILGEADELSDTYRQARAAWSGPTSSATAMERGTSFIRKPAEMTKRQLESLPDSDKDFFRLGAARAMQEKIDSAADTADVVKRIFGNKAMRDKLAAVFPDKEAFSKFEKQMRNEARMARTKRVAGGSPTQPRQAKARDIGMDPAPLVDVASGNTGNAVVNAGRGVLGGLLNPMDERTSRELARALFTSDPATNRALLGQIAKQQEPNQLMRSLGLLGETGVLTGAGQAGSLLAAPQANQSP